MHGPIAQAELAHQWHSTGQPRWRQQLYAVERRVGLALALILYGGELAGALLRRDPTPIGETLGFAATLLVIFTGLYHFLLMFRTLALGANSITREKTGKTWEMLVLTGVDARQIVWGKWWATVLRQWRQYALLGVLRAGVIAWLGGSASRILASIYTSYGYTYGDLQTVLPSALDVLAAGLVVFLLTLANLGFTAACGVLASSETRSGALALARAVATRLTILFVALMILMLPSVILDLAGWWLDRVQLGSNFSLMDVLSRTSITLLDNGASLGSELVAYRLGNTSGSTPSALAAAILSLAIYGVMTWGLLRMAQRRAVRHLALPPEENKPANHITKRL